MSENNGQQNPEESYRSKYPKHIAYSYGYKIVCVDDKFSKLFNVIFNFGNSMIQESKFCREVMKKNVIKNM